MVIVVVNNVKKFRASIIATQRNSCVSRKKHWKSFQKKKRKLIKTFSFTRVELQQNKTLILLEKCK